jgi:hypothetical protein
MSCHDVCAGIQTLHGHFHPKEIVEIHGGALQCTDQAITAKVMAMEWFCQNLEWRGGGCQTNEEYLDLMMTP